MIGNHSQVRRQIEKGLDFSAAHFRDWQAMSSAGGMLQHLLLAIILDDSALLEQRAPCQLHHHTVT